MAFDDRTPNGERLSLYDLDKEGRVKVALLWWQERGLSYTASGYGAKIPTSRKVHVKGRWRRVYYTCYSNAGTCWIVVDGHKVLVAS